MSFFEPPPPQPDPPEAQRQPAWFGPPENELGCPLARRIVLVRRADLLICVTELVAYSRGFTAHLGVRRRSEELGDDPFHPFVHRASRTAELAPELLRFGVEFADGAKATNSAGFPPHGFEEEPAGPVLMMRGGGGGGRSWDYGFWIWPLPPPGPLAFVVEWPAQGVELTRSELDAKLVLDGARRSEVPWPDDDGPGGAVGSWTSSGG